MAVALRDTCPELAMPDSRHPLYSIGYATKPLETFLAQLAYANITAIADIRSVPYSNNFFDYHREALQQSLKAAGISYVCPKHSVGVRWRKVWA